MRPDEYILQVKEKHGQQRTKDGILIRDMNDKALLKRMIQRYPADADGIIGIDAYLTEEDKETIPPGPETETQGAISRVLASIGNRTGMEWMEATKKLGEGIQRGADKLNAAPDGSTIGGQVARTGALLETGLNTAAGGVRTLFAPATAAVQEGVDALADNEAVQDFAQTDVAGLALDPYEGAMDDFTEWSKAHPDESRNLIDAFTVATAGLGEGATGTLGGTKLGVLNKTVGKEVAGAVKTGTNAVVDATAEAASKVGVNVKTAAQRATEKARTDAVNGLESTYDELFTGTKAQTGRYQRSQAATAAKNKAGTAGTAPSRTLAEAGIVPNQAGGKLKTIAQADEFRRTVAPLARANRAALEEVQRGSMPLVLDDLESAAVRAAKSTENVNNGTAASLAKEIEQEFANLREAYGDTLPITVADDIKSARWGKTAFDGNRPLLGQANYLIAKSAQQAIEDAALAGGFKEVAQLNRIVGDRLEAAKFLQDLDNKTVKGGRLQRYVFQAIGSTMGTSVPGKIIGALGGDAVANLLISNSVAGPVKRMILKNLEKEDPAAYKTAQAWLEKQGIERDARLQLPAPDGDTPIPMGAAEEKAQVFDNYDDYLEAQGIVRTPEERLALPEGKPGTSEKPIAVPARTLTDVESAEAKARVEGKVSTDKEKEDFSSGAVPETAEEVSRAAEAKYDADPEGMLSEYLAENGNVVNTDNARSLFREVGYTGANSAAVHVAAKKVSDAAFTKLVNDAKEGDDAFFMAGGSGAGKTTGTRAFQDQMKKAAVVFDGNLSKYDSAKKKIQEAEAAGLNVTIPYVFRNPIEAFNGTIDRLLGSGPDGGRVVPITNFLENTPGALKVAQRLYDEGYPIVPMKFVSYKVGGKEMAAEEFKKLVLPEKLEAILVREAEKRASEMTKDQYEALLDGVAHQPYEDLQ